MQSLEHQGDPQMRTWTCGGIIHVNGIPYALTAAHPLIPYSRTKQQDDVEWTKPSVVDYVFPESRPSGLNGVQSWQTLGRVHGYALSDGDHVPANYDWLLIDIANGHLLPNFSVDMDRDEEVQYKSLSICTWRGSLQATLLPGISFTIFGESSFKAMKLLVDKPMGVLADFLCKCFF
jgi:hypothetical protein